MKGGVCTSKKKAKGGAGKKIKGGAGITAGRDANIGAVSGQLVIGDKNTLTQTLSSAEKKDLQDNLAQFQKEIVKMKLPPDEAATIKGDVTAAVKEAEKEQPDTKKIQSRFQGAIDTIKEVGTTKEVGNAIEAVSKWDWTKKILATLGKIGLSIVMA